jgi:hypothetical protein
MTSSLPSESAPSRTSRERRQAPLQSPAQGSPWLKTTLVQCAWAAVRQKERQKDSYLRAQFYHIRARRSPKKAIVAVAASILTAVYHMLKEGKMYQDLGRNHFQRRNKDQQKHLLVNRLANLGYAVALTPLAG